MSEPVKKISDQKQPLVSIGMPVFNGEKYIRIAIEALLKQEYKNFELIICDNASTDKTYEICQEYREQDKRISLYQNEKNIGANKNFIRVYEMAKGDYFMMAAHDDYYHREYIAKCLKKLMESPGAVGCFSDIEMIDENGNKRTDLAFSGIETEGLDIPGRVKALISRGLFWYEIYSLYPMEVMKKLDFNQPVNFGPDVVLLMELLLMGELVKVPEKLFYYRFIPAQKTHENDMNNLLPGLKPPERPYTTLFKKLYSTVMESDIDEKVKQEVYHTFIETLPVRNPGWLHEILKENNLPAEQQKIFLQGVLIDNQFYGSTLPPPQKSTENNQANEQAKIINSKEEKTLSETDIQKIKEITPELEELLKDKKYELLNWTLNGMLAEYPGHSDLLKLQAEAELLKGNNIEVKI